MNRQERLEINRAAWDAYQADYLRFNLEEYPDFFERLGNGGVLLDDQVVELAGDVDGVDLLDRVAASVSTQSQALAQRWTVANAPVLGRLGSAASATFVTRKGWQI